MEILDKNIQKFTPLTVSQPFVSKISYILEHLKKVSLNSDISYRHSAALFKKNKVISVGYNKSVKQININNTTRNSFKITVHAEVNALYQACKKHNLRGIDIIIIRTKNLCNGQITLRNSRPCNDCIDKMTKIGIRKVYYSNSNGDIVYEFLDNMLKTHISSGQKNLKLLKCNS